MIGYLCKYTPIELFYGFGETPQLIDPLPMDSQNADLHPNLCSFAKSACTHCVQNNVSQIVFTSCCDSIKRIYDVLGTSVSFESMLSLPRVHTPESVRLYADGLMQFIQKFGDYADRKFDVESFKQAVLAASSAKQPEDQPHIAVLGARMPAGLLQSAQDCCTLPILDNTCTGQTRVFGAMPKTNDLQALMEWYAGELLSQPPCMRMQDVSQRSDYSSNTHLKGIIYHTIKFCDYYGFEYAALKKSSSLPVLKLESDYADAGSGQFRTRIEAFFESLGILSEPAPASTPTYIKQTVSQKYFAGIDSGSTSTDAVLLDGDLNILGYSILPTGGRSVDGAQAALKDLLAKCGIQYE
ncbi:MAG: 2-hydroxyacyl-CoA dehydratase, partial [Eubacteriales bacterium]